MTTEWTLTSQALDQHDTVAALASALPNEDDLPIDLGDPAERCQLAEEIAVTLARAGFALIRLAPVPFTARTED